MIKSRPYRLAEDCPNCGQKDAPNAWKGARVWSTNWGHGFSCCSDACGVAFANSPERFTREIALIDEHIDGLIVKRKRFEDQLRGALGKT